MLQGLSEIEQKFLVRAIKLQVPKLVVDGAAARTIWGLVGRRAFDSLAKNATERDRVLKGLVKKRAIQEPKEKKFQLVG